VIAPNGVELERYEDLPGARKKPGTRLALPDRFTAGYTGHLYPGRGYRPAGRIGRIVIRRVQFLWVGGRPKDVLEWKSAIGVRKYLECLINRVSLRTASLPLYQAAMDVLLMPYERRIEGSSGGNSVDFCQPDEDVRVHGHVVVRSYPATCL
jgi:hypothetical protein